MDDLNGRVNLDGIVCLVDHVNHTESEKNFKIAVEQLHAADIILLNKAQEADPEVLSSLKDSISKINAYASILENQNDLKKNLIIETGKWSYNQIVEVEEEHGHDEDGACEHCGGDCGCGHKNNAKEGFEAEESYENCSGNWGCHNHNEDHDHEHHHEHE